MMDNERKVNNEILWTEYIVSDELLNKMEISSHA